VKICLCFCVALILCQSISILNLNVLGVLAQATTIPVNTLQGTGNVNRKWLTHNELFGKNSPSAPVDDSAGFAIPPNGAEPTQSFEGTLTLNNPESNGSFTELSDVFQLIPQGDSPWKHLPAFSFQFVQNGSYLIPAQQGLAITGNPSWNYIVGPGRVWRENSDEGYMRASLPFSLVQRNQNCVHNGEMTFLFDTAKSPQISNVYYQITQETCYPMKFNMWGIVSATYTPNAVAGSVTLKENYAAELSQRMATKPFSALATDFSRPGVNLEAFTHAYKSPEDITTFGIVIRGINYVAGCPTRFGEYAFCADMRLPSYSIAKSVFAGVALMRLGQLYGSEVYDQLIKDYIPQYVFGGKWDATTFGNASDMATGNYNLAEYEADEDSPTMDKFLVDEDYASKIADAFAFRQNYAPPGTRWIYQSSATFILTQAMNAYLQQKRGTKADLFDMVRDDVYKPLQVSQGGLTTIRTDNSSTGAPSGYYGLFLTQDDIAKIGNFLNNGTGAINGAQVLNPIRLNEALFRTKPNSPVPGVPIVGSSVASALGAPVLGHSPVPNSRRYSHGFWGRYMSTAEFPQYSCSFWISFMSGYGGNIVAMLPNGTTFYVFSDGKEFPWVNSILEINKLAPICT
jgi:Beta-lactamase